MIKLNRFQNQKAKENYECDRLRPSDRTLRLPRPCRGLVFFPGDVGDRLDLSSWLPMDNALDRSGCIIDNSSIAAFSCNSISSNVGLSSGLPDQQAFIRDCTHMGKNDV
jgi:hypothetical protein